ncbi:MAG: decarboxylase [Lachnospiraceae bacterium]|nr:decarboxylase [Lachnospiraceae bacterium]
MKRPQLRQKIERYVQGDVYPFHMPGHKRAGVFPDQGMAGRSPVVHDGSGWDITELEGFDNLHRPEGVLKESMEWASGVYGSDRTYYLVNGSTCGVLSAVCAATSNGGTILMARNCHQSAYHGAALNRLGCVFVYPKICGRLGIFGGVDPSDVEKLLLSTPGVQAVIIVSPTYEGVVSDVRRIGEITHGFGVPLIVDEAHGAHLPFDHEKPRATPRGREAGTGPGVRFPADALSLGADMVVQSLHKTLPSLTQTAVLHVKGSLVDTGKLEMYLRIFQSSSPSYILLSSIEECIGRMESARGQGEMGDWKLGLAEMRNNLSGLGRLRVVGTEMIGHDGVFDLDLSKVLVSTVGSGCDGHELSRRLREKYSLEMEMQASGHVLAYTSPADSREGFRRLSDALLAIDGELSAGASCQDQENPHAGDGDGPGESAISKKVDEIPHAGYGDGPVACHLPQSTEAFAGRMCDALEGETQEVALEQAPGRIAARFIMRSPPGIPLVVPGQILDEAAIRLLQPDAGQEKIGGGRNTICILK